MLLIKYSICSSEYNLEDTGSSRSRYNTEKVIMAILDEVVRRACSYIFVPPAK